MIPSVDACLNLMEEYGMLDNIKAHSIVVARVADLIGCSLIKKGVPLNLDIIVSGALLHDIAKTACLNNDANHANLGREICLKHNFTELADCVGEHVILEPTSPDSISEREIVYYADKRVMHEDIVSIKERLAYILERYGNNDAKRHQVIEKNFIRCQDLEEKIFLPLNFSPEDIKNIIEKSGNQHALAELTFCQSLSSYDVAEECNHKLSNIG